MPPLWCPNCLARAWRRACRYRGASPWLSTPQIATGWMPPRRSLSRTRRVGIFKLRSLSRLCLAFCMRCFMTGILRARPAWWSMPRSLMTGTTGGSFSVRSSLRARLTCLSVPMKAVFLALTFMPSSVSLRCRSRYASTAWWATPWGVLLAVS